MNLPSRSLVLSCFNKTDKAYLSHTIGYFYNYVHDYEFKNKYELWK